MTPELTFTAFFSRLSSFWIWDLKLVMFVPINCHGFYAGIRTLTTLKLILRRLRSLGVYSEMLPCTQKLKDLGWKPVGIILSGGPSSVYAPDSPSVDPMVFELGVPILYVVNHGHDGKVADKPKRRLLRQPTDRYSRPLESLLEDHELTASSKHGVLIRIMWHPARTVSTEKPR